MNDKLDCFKQELELVIDWVELENEKCDHSGTKSSSTMVVPNILSLVGFVVILYTFQL